MSRLSIVKDSLLREVGNLAPGVVFESGGGYYMKIVASGQMNAVCLSGPFAITAFSDLTKVRLTELAELKLS